MSLNPKQKAFADAYIKNGGNATQAAIQAGYSERSARPNGSRMLTNADVLAYIAQQQAEKTNGYFSERALRIHVGSILPHNG